MSERCQYWWVNQGTTFHIVQTRSFLWAAEHAADGRTIHHHETMKELRSNDIVFHYANQAIQGISRVITRAERKPRPKAFPQQPRKPYGYQAAVDFHLLPRAIPLWDIPEDLRTPSVGPFSINGTPQQGYLFGVTSAFVQEILEPFRIMLPPGLVITSTK